MSKIDFDLSQTPDLWFDRLISLDPAYVQNRINDFLQEDMPQGDATTEATIGPEIMSKAYVLANQEMIFAGEAILKPMFSHPEICEIKAQDGKKYQKGDVLAILKGTAHELLSRERVMLNLLQRLCGIATLAHEYASLEAPKGFRILDTRKTTPGLRLFEKYAVAAGGAYNHRLDLSSVIMIKDNHLVAAGGIAPALAKVRKHNIKELFVELEVDTLEQLAEALDTGGFDAFLLDNMSPDTIRESVALVRKHPKGGMRIFLEASGGITRETLPDYIWTGVNGISIGALTTQARNVDIKLEFID